MSHESAYGQCGQPEVEAADPMPRSDATTEAVYEVISTMDQPTQDPRKGRQVKVAPDPTRIMATKQRLDIPVRLLDLPEAERRRILDLNAEHRRIADQVFPPQPDKLGLADIDDYYAESGLSTAPASIMAPNEFVDCAKKMLASGYCHYALEDLIAVYESGASLDDIDANAHFLDDLGRVVVMVPPGKITGDRRTIVASTVAHEKGHSTATRWDDVYVYLQGNRDLHNGFRMSRGGFSVYDDSIGEAGYFLEEGYCELKAADYVRTRLGLPNGLWTDGDKFKKIAGVVLPSIYVMYDPDTGASNTGIGAIPAHALELISVEYPELLSALDESRTSVQGLRKVARIIDGVAPGIYSDLRRLQLAADPFKRGLKAVQQRLEKP